MRLTLSQENEQYGRKILQMSHRNYKEMRGSTAVQYCRHLLPLQYTAIHSSTGLYCRFGQYCGEYFPLPLAGFCPWSLVSFYEITVL
jgi:hypothetical protein